LKDDTGTAFGLREDLFRKFAKQFEEAQMANEITKSGVVPLEDAALFVQHGTKH
jgi:hypothetical protein